MSSDYDEQLQTYLDELVPVRPLELQAMEAYAVKHQFPIIGPASGQFCYQITRLVGARRVFELGSGYGYSTAWFARGVQENGGGNVYHVVWDAELSNQAKGHLSKLGFDGTVTYIVSEAVQALRQTDGPFDLIFLDINKDAYPKSLPVIEEKLRPGGVLIVDNTLWHGRIFDESDHSPATNAIREFTQLITTSPDWIVSLVPIRDGLIIATKV
ncbi:MAG: O-methyltransferase [Anaerolineae bacterium]|jgi:caffeoyl-CoA O-methyltransferase